MNPAMIDPFRCLALRCVLPPSQEPAVEDRLRPSLARPAGEGGPLAERAVAEGERPPRSGAPVGSGVMLRLSLLALVLLAGCEHPTQRTGLSGPVELDSASACALDGMLLIDYPGPKAQIQYAGSGQTDFFCDPVEMLSLYLSPEQVRKVHALYVQDMGKAAWEAPVDHWIDARTAYYVHGSTRHGAMGPTLVTFALEADAQRFTAQYGGHLMRFDQLKPGMLDLHGGALHDTRM